MNRVCRWVSSLLAASVVLMASATGAQEPDAVHTLASAGSEFRAVGLACAAAFAIAVSVLGAAHAIGKIGTAAMGAATERPELLTRSILFIALAEGLAILGFAIAMVLAQRI